MSEEENTNVDAQASEAVVEASQSETASGNESPEAQKKRKDAEHNWAESNRVMKELKQKNRELEERIANFEKPQKPTESHEEDPGIRDDDLIEGKHFKNVVKELKELKSFVEKQHVTTVDERLAMKFQDFDAIVTPEAIEELKQNEPELARSVASNPDPYAQGVAIYKLLKRFNGSEDMSKSLEKKKALENSQKPLSVNAVSKTSAIGNAHLFENGLTPDLKKQLWKEMEEARKRM